MTRCGARVVLGAVALSLGMAACDDAGGTSEDAAGGSGSGGSDAAGVGGAGSSSASTSSATVATSSAASTSSTGGDQGSGGDGDGAAGGGDAGGGGVGGSVPEGTTLAEVDSPTGLAVDRDFVWFGSRGHAPDFADGYVAKVPRSGGEVVVVAEAQARPLNIVLGGDRVAWNRRDVGTDPVTGSIVVMSREDGAEPVVVASGVEGPNNPVFVGDTIWFGSADGTIRSAPIDGSQGEAAGTVVATLGYPSDLTTDGGDVFWADAGTDETAPAIVRRRIADGDEIALSTGITQPSFRLGVGYSFVFVGSRDAGTLLRVARDGSGTDLLAQGIIGSPHEVVVDESRGRVYFTTGDLGAVLSVSSSEVPTFPSIEAQHQGFTSYLAADEDYLFWSAGALDEDGGAIRTKAK